MADSSLYTLSVQFLNRATFVTDLVEKHSLLPKLATSLRDALLCASKLAPRAEERQSGNGGTLGANAINALASLGVTLPPAQLEALQTLNFEPNGTLSLTDLNGLNDATDLNIDLNDVEHGEPSPGSGGGGSCGSAGSGRSPLRGPLTLRTDHLVLLHRRYSPVIADLKCVLNIEGMSRRFCALPPGAMAAAVAAAEELNDFVLDGYGTGTAVALLATNANRNASRMDVERKPSPYKQRHSDSAWRSDSDGEGADEESNESGSLKGRRLRRRLADLSVGSEEELRNGKGVQGGTGENGGRGGCLSAWIDTLSLVQVTTQPRFSLSFQFA